MPTNVLVVGGSQNIGYYASVRLLNKGATVTFLLRNPSKFDDDEVIQKYVKAGTAKLVKGDATVVEDVKKVWDEALSIGSIDILLITVGFVGTPAFSLLHGFKISPPNLVTSTMLNFLPHLSTSTTRTKVILVSTSGSTPSGRKASPLLLKPVYGYMIHGPAEDKRGAERVIAHAAGWEWGAKDTAPNEEVLPNGWEAGAGIPVKGGLKDKASFCVVRAAMLTDGECLADSVPQGEKLPYRGEVGNVSGYQVSRKDTAHFIVEQVLEKWDVFGDNVCGIAY